MCQSFAPEIPDRTGDISYSYSLVLNGMTLESVDAYRERVCVRLFRKLNCKLPRAKENMVLGTTQHDEHEDDDLAGAIPGATGPTIICLQNVLSGE